MNELYNSVELLLQSDEDMANMYLTEKSLNRPRKKESHEEVEILLETFYSQFEGNFFKLKKIHKTESRNLFLESNQLKIF